MCDTYKIYVKKFRNSVLIYEISWLPLLNCILDLLLCFPLAESERLVLPWWPFALSQWELRMWFEIRGGWTAVTRRYREACGIGKNLTIIRFFRFKMRVKFTVADESSRKFSVLYESVVSVAIRCIFMRFSERFRVTLVSDPTWSLQPSIFICI